MFEIIYVYICGGYEDHLLRKTLWVETLPNWREQGYSYSALPNVL